MQYVIRVSEQVLMTMLLNGIEAYVVENKNKNFRGRGCAIQLETLGHLYGTRTGRDDDAEFVNIEFLNIDTTALQMNGSVEESENAFEIKENLISTYWPYWSYLGSFHTHPFEHPKNVAACNGYYASDNDKASMIERGEFVALILTIAKMERSRDNGTKYIVGHSNSIEFTISNLRMWLTAYATDKIEDDEQSEEPELLCSEDKAENVILDCPSLTGMTWTHGQAFRFVVEGQKFCLK